MNTTWERVRAQALGGQLEVEPVVGAVVESHYPIRVVATTPSIDPMIKFHVKGSALGFVPIVIGGLPSHAVPAGNGLWVKASGAQNFTLLKQSSSGNDFWQTNYDRRSATYEIVYNVEIFSDTMFAFGSVAASTAEAFTTTSST